MAKKALIGAGLAAGAALAAYLMTTPKDRKKAAIKIKGWMNDMKKEVAERVKSAQDVSKEKYEAIIDDVKPKYKAIKDVGTEEMEAFSKELKAHWNNISKVVAKAGKGKRK